MTDRGNDHLDQLDGIIVDTGAAAHFAEVKPATIRSWAHRPTTGVNRYPGGFDLGELARFLHRRNTQKVHRRAAA